jgi:hypothetical protein
VEVNHAASKAIESAAQRADSTLAGVKKQFPEHEEDPVVFVPFGMKDLDAVYENLDPDDYVIGQEDSEIQYALERRFPVPDGMTKIYKGNFRIRSSVRVGYYSRKKWATNTVEGWCVSTRPICQANDLDTYRELCVKHGVLFLPFRHDWSEEELNAAGFTVCEGGGGFTQINYNPRSIELRPHRAKQREVKKRLNGFPKEVLYDLFDMIHTDHWTYEHPCHGIFRGWDRFETRGWGHRKYRTCSISDVLQLLDANLRVWNKRWWRCKDTSSCYNPPAIVREALLYLHGVEDDAKKCLADKVAALRREWADYVKAFEKNPEDYETDKPLEWEEYRKQYREDLEDSDELRICRWLRTEARAMKVKMPRRPVMPKLRRKKKRRKRGRRSRA